MKFVLHSESSGIERYELLAHNAPVSFTEVIQSWIHDEAFRKLFSDTLRNSQWSAFRFETPPVNDSILPKRGFEFVLLDSPALDRPTDSAAFAKHLAEATSTVVSFANLSGDAQMIVPGPSVPPEDYDRTYGHLAEFVRNAPSDQVDLLWQTVGHVLNTKLGAQPRWLSTAGMGVSWLHVRIDSRPKYYGYSRYRQWNEASLTDSVDR